MLSFAWIRTRLYLDRRASALGQNATKGRLEELQARVCESIQQCSRTMSQIRIRCKTSRVGEGLQRMGTTDPSGNGNFDHAAWAEACIEGETSTNPQRVKRALDERQCLMKAPAS